MEGCIVRDSQVSSGIAGANDRIGCLVGNMDKSCITYSDEKRVARG
ncbi:MAG: hypothetical protein V8S14_07595 [Lachnospiraceae bacterium]